MKCLFLDMKCLFSSYSLFLDISSLEMKTNVVAELIG